MVTTNLPCLCVATTTHGEKKVETTTKMRRDKLRKHALLVLFWIFIENPTPHNRALPAG